MKPHNCKRCEHADAETDGVDLYFDGKKVPLEPLCVIWTCRKCKAEVKWRSTRGRKVLH